MKKTLLTIGITVFVIGVALFGSAYFVLAQGENTINACVDKDGALRIVTQEEQCKKKESPLSWNVQGEQGPQGPQGSVGPTMARSGIVYRDGSSHGNNFTVSKIRTGEYQISFDEGVFSGHPIPTVTLFENVNRNGVTPIISLLSEGESTFNVLFLDSAGNLIDVQFTFIAVDSSIHSTTP